LKPGGLFKFQVQGNTGEEPNLDDSWIGYWFNPEDARKLAAENGFELRFDWGAGSQYYWLWFFKK
jgi:hypothetical protein